MEKTFILSMTCVVLFAVSGSVQGTVVPIAYWNCDDAVGSTTLTDSIGGVNGTLTGSIIFEASGVGPEYGNALYSNNRNNYVSLGSDAWSLGTGDFTVTGWFKVPGLQARHGNVITLGAWNTGGFEITLLKDANVDGIAQGNEGKMQFTVFGNAVTADNKYVISDAVLVDTQWHWFAGVVSGQTLSLYVDGTLQAASHVAYGATTTASTAGVGYIARNMVNWADDLAIYRAALSGTVSGNTLTGGELYEVWQSGVVPEPATLLLLSGGALLLRKRR